MIKKRKIISVMLLLSFFVIGFVLGENASYFKKKEKVALSVTAAKHVDFGYNVHLVTYAGGPEVYFRNQNALLYSALNQGVDFFYAYRRKHLDAEFQKKNKHIYLDSEISTTLDPQDTSKHLSDEFETKSKHLLGHKRGDGYWIWKPYVILETMKKAAENDVIIYLDSGVIVAEDGAIINLLQRFENSKKDLMGRGLSNFFTKHYMKRDLMVYMNMDEDKYFNYPMMESNVLFIKNNSKMRAFINEWLEIIQNAQMVNDAPSINKEYDWLIEHRHDQSILTTLTIKYPSCCEFMYGMDDPPRGLELHRRRDENKYLYMQKR